MNICLWEGGILRDVEGFLSALEISLFSLAPNILVVIFEHHSVITAFLNLEFYSHSHLVLLG